VHALTRLRAAAAGAAVAVVSVTGLCQPKPEPLPAGCTSAPARSAPSAGAGRVAWSVPLAKGHDVAGDAAIGPLLYVPTSIWATAASEEHDNRTTAYDPVDGREVWRQDGVLDTLDLAT